MTFRSKIDTWVWLAFAISIVAVAVSAAPAFLADDVALPFVFATLGACGLAMGLFLWMLLSTYYVVEEQTLRIQSGPFRWRLKRDEIRTLSRTRSPLSSPALSLDRIEIRYGARGRVLVSPEDAQGFAAALGVPID